MMLRDGEPSEPSLRLRMEPVEPSESSTSFAVAPAELCCARWLRAAPLRLSLSRASSHCAYECNSCSTPVWPTDLRGMKHSRPKGTLRVSLFADSRVIMFTHYDPLLVVSAVEATK